MKTHTIKTPTAELLIVELPERASMLPIAIINGNTYISYSPAPFAPPTNLELLANGNWEALGKPDEIREEDARELVDMVGDGDPCYQGDWFENYQDDESIFETAKESLLSLLESEIYWDLNPEGKSPRYAFDESINPRDIKARAYHQKWHEAQEKTFDRSRSIILVKQ